MSKEVAAALSEASKISGLLTVAPGPIGIVASIASIALKAASAIAAAGQDPVIEITRILSSVGPVAAVDDDWNTIIDNEFADTEASPEPAPVPRRITQPSGALPPPPISAPPPVPPIPPLKVPSIIEDDPTPPAPSPSSGIYDDDEER